MSKTCKTCRFRKDGVMENQATENCVRYPPHYYDGVGWTFPLVLPSWGCGEWQPSNEAIQESVKRQVEELERVQ